MAEQCPDKTIEEPALEAEWNSVCNTLDLFLHGERAHGVLFVDRLHPTTMQRLRDTYQLEVSEWVNGCHNIDRPRVNEKIADSTIGETSLETQWTDICSTLGPFLRGENTDDVLLVHRLHPTTMQRLRDTYHLEVSEWTNGAHSIGRTRVDQKIAEATIKETALEAQWTGICSALGPFLRGESTDTVFVMQRLHPTTMQRLRDTYHLEVSGFEMGPHMITRPLVNPCANAKVGQCLLKCVCVCQGK